MTLGTSWPVVPRGDGLHGVLSWGVHGLGSYRGMRSSSVSFVSTHSDPSGPSPSVHEVSAIGTSRAPVMKAALQLELLPLSHTPGRLRCGIDVVCLVATAAILLSAHVLECLSQGELREWLYVPPGLFLPDGGERRRGGAPLDCAHSAGPPTKVLYSPRSLCREKIRSARASGSWSGSPPPMPRGMISCAMWICSEARASWSIWP